MKMYSGLARGKGLPKDALIPSAPISRSADQQSGAADAAANHCGTVQALSSTDALNLHSLDTRLILFCSNHAQGIPTQLWRVAKQRKTHKEAGKVNMS